jgi:uncharacterized protein with PIN domain
VERLLARMLRLCGLDTKSLHSDVCKSSSADLQQAIVSEGPAVRI